MTDPDLTIDRVIFRSYIDSIQPLIRELAKHAPAEVVAEEIAWRAWRQAKKETSAGDN